MATTYYKFTSAASLASPTTGDTYYIAYSDTVTANLDYNTFSTLVSSQPNWRWAFKSRVWEVQNLGTSYGGSIDYSIINDDFINVYSTSPVTVYVGFSIPIDVNFFAKNNIWITDGTYGSVFQDYNFPFFSGASFTTNFGGFRVGSDTNIYTPIILDSVQDYTHITNFTVTTYDFANSTPIDGGVLGSNLPVIPYSATSAINYYNTVVDAWVSKYVECNDPSEFSSASYYYVGNFPSPTTAFDSQFGGECFTFNSAMAPFSGTPSTYYTDLIENTYVDCPTCEASVDHLDIYYHKVGTDCSGNTLTPELIFTATTSQIDTNPWGVTDKAYVKLNYSGGDVCINPEGTWSVVSAQTTNATLINLYSNCTNCANNIPITPTPTPTLTVTPTFTPTKTLTPTATPSVVFVNVVVTDCCTNTIQFNLSVPQTNSSIGDVYSFQGCCYEIIDTALEDAQFSSTEYFGTCESCYGEYPCENWTADITDCCTSLVTTIDGVGCTVPNNGDIIKYLGDCYEVQNVQLGGSGTAFIPSFEIYDSCLECEVCPSETPTPTFTSTPTQTPTFTQTPTETETPTPTPTYTLTQTITQTPTSSIGGTLTPTQTETETPTPTPTFTQTPTETETPTPTPTQTETETPTPTPTSSIGGTLTPTQTETETPTPTPTITQTETETPTPTPTFTLTQTPTSSIGGTLTPTQTETETPTPTPTYTLTQTITQTPTSSIGGTLTPTQTETETPTPTPTYTPTPSPTEPYDVYLFSACCDGSLFRFEYVSGTLNEGDTYIISSSLDFTGCATILPYTATGPLYSASGVVFTNSGGDCTVCEGFSPCPSPTPTITPTLTQTPTLTPTETVTQTPTVTETPTTTPTSSVTPTISPSTNCTCVEYTLVNTSDIIIAQVQYIDCLYNDQQIELLPLESNTVCVCQGSLIYPVEVTVTLEGNCPPIPSQTRTPNPTATPTPTNIPCTEDDFCLYTQLASLQTYNGNYVSGGTYNSRPYFVGDGTTTGYIFYNGSYWCLSDSLGGPCYLQGAFPCNSPCPDISANFFTVGPCPTPTPSPINCNSLDFNAYFDCDYVPYPTPSPSINCDLLDLNVTSFPVSPTPTPSTPTCDTGIGFYISGYTEPTASPTPSPTIEPTRTVDVGGQVTYRFIDNTFICVGSKVLLDCTSGLELYTSDPLVYSGTPLVVGTYFLGNIAGQYFCLQYLRDDDTFSANVSIDSVLNIYGNCVDCQVVLTPTPSITPTNTPTPSITPTATVTPSSTFEAAPVYYVFETCSLNSSGNPSAVISQTVPVNFAINVGQSFKDSEDQCWKYLGAFTSYYPQGNTNYVTYNTNYFNITPVVYGSCELCIGGQPTPVNCVRFTDEIFRVGKPDGCGSYDREESLVTVTLFDQSGTSVVAATTNITVVMDIAVQDCLGQSTEVLTISIPQGQSSGTGVYNSYNKEICPVTSLCGDVLKSIRGISSITPSTVIEC
jgi:hypothetical protein